MNFERGLLFSLLVHFVLYFVLDKTAPYFADKGPKPVEIEIVSSPKNNNSLGRQVISQAEVPESQKIEDLQKKANFYSQKTQRVKQETKVIKRGRTQNEAESAEKTSSDLAKNFLKPSSAAEILQNGLENVQQGKTKASRQQARRAVSESSVNESLPDDMTVGDMTALNTDAYLYYTFYERVEDAIRYRWENKVWRALQSFAPHMLKHNIANRPWKTQVEFLLDPAGRLVKAMVMKESGVQIFDQAAIGAFTDVQIFPNPPKDLVQEDGYIHLKYGFTVNYGLNE